MKQKSRKKKRYRYVFIAIILIGTIWQAIMTQIESKQFSQQGEKLNVGTYQMNYYTKGTGDIAYCFITGSGTPCAYTDFYNLQTMLSEVGQTISFDHAGSGFSSNTKTKRIIDHLVQELAVLIDAVAPNKPIILICHSLGSLEAIGYAQMYPEKVKGIIFLDSGSPEFYSKDSELQGILINRGSALIRTIGLNRLLGECGIFLPIYGENVRNNNIPSKIRSLDQVMFYRFTGNRASIETIKQMNENAKSILNRGKLNDIPILVLSSDQDAEWNDVQHQLASWSTKSEQVTIKSSNHYLYWSNYDEVVLYIKSFIQTL